ncbi:hypothetical protein CCACVL1_01116 [Corchorus capsularis]|uniref:Pyridine nucleotide-disulphide oxidoreductase N-terminal domain-containing protein n=1 Tax=Corchorus capsularis TaxID=210143 RepID=A0A1R3KMQ5_COCAP|nr:hypothetical protein CCACVL1_01116 [Corchorus capsularis]
MAVIDVENGESSVEVEMKEPFLHHTKGSKRTGSLKQISASNQHGLKSGSCKSSLQVDSEQVGFIGQKKVLRGFDEEIRDFVGEQMALRGIEFHTEETPQAIVKAADGSLVSEDQQ